MSISKFHLKNRGKHESSIQQINFTSNAIITEIISKETLPEEFKPTASEKFEFKNRQNRKFNWTILKDQLINIPI